MREYLESKFAHIEQLIDLRFGSAQMAVDKAELATRLRFESVNEFRAALTDQTRSFASQQAVETLASTTINLINGLEKTTRTSNETLLNTVNSSDKRIANLEGRMVAYVGVVGLIVTFLSAVISLAGHLLK